MGSVEMALSMEEAHNLLYRLGVTANYTGFFQTAYAISLCMEQQERLTLATKWLYPEVAKRYDTNWKAVERNIRLTVSRIWENNRPLLERVAYRPLTQQPCVSAFLAMSTQYLLSGASCNRGRAQT